jgi:hypothetical protein
MKAVLEGFSLCRAETLGKTMKKIVVRIIKITKNNKSQRIQPLDMGGRPLQGVVIYLNMGKRGFSFNYWLALPLGFAPLPKSLPSQAHMRTGPVFGFLLADAPGGGGFQEFIYGDRDSRELSL